MSFGRAIVVVVVLHLVAVAGICGFLKTRNFAQQGAPPRQARDAAAEPGAAGDAVTSVGGQAAAQEVRPRVSVPSPPVITPVKQPVAAGSAPQTARPPVNESSSSVKDSGALYTVARGDTPASIARKLHVGYDDLLKLNKITDPKKLKIGQKLRIPVKKKTTSAT